MNRFLLSFLLYLFCINLNSQNYTITTNGILPAINTATYLTMEFTIDRSFNNKSIEIYKTDETTIASLPNGKLGTTIPKNSDGKFTLTILNDHRIKQCEECMNITDDFKLKLDGKFYGPFHLVPFSQENSNGNTGTQPLTIKEPVVIDNYQTGYVLYDAIYLNSLTKTEAAQILVVLKSSYGIKENKDVANNKYLNGVFPYLVGYNSPQGSGNPLSVASLASSVGGLDVTTIADGFAKFVVKRTKKELSITFFENFKKELSKSKDLENIFPQTYRTLLTIGEEIYLYQSYLVTLRESFEKDLSSLPSNLHYIIENHPEIFDDEQELKATLLSGFYFANAITEHQHPGEIIENFPSEVTDSLNKNFQASLKTFQLISSSFKSNSGTDNYWAPHKDIEKLYNDDKLLTIYLGLLEQKAKQNPVIFYDSFQKPVELNRIIDSAYGNIAHLLKYKTFIKNISQKVNAIETKVTYSRKINNDSLLFENYYTMVSNSISLLRLLTKVETLPYVPGNLNLESKSKKYFDIIQTSSDIAIDVNRKNYASAILNTVYLLDSTIANETTKKILKYGSFMATAVQAKTSDEVEAAIEAVALPAGSARIKRITPFNVALNAYSGLFIGWEEIKGVDQPFDISKGRTHNTYGVAAPIGISISTSLKGFSFSGFVSVVDIGALTAFRFTNDSTEKIPKIELKDIVSPGAFFSLGIPKTPISLNIGYQLGPLLRKVNQQANTYEQNYSRISIALCVDIPIFNFYTKPKK